MRLIKSPESLKAHSRLQSRAFDASDEFTKHKAAVVADGGTVFSDADTQDLISDLIAANAWKETVLAVSAFGGAKDLNNLNQRLYSVGPNSPLKNTGSGTLGFVQRDTSTYSVETLKFVTGASLAWADFPVNSAPGFSVLITYVGGGTGAPTTGLTVNFSVNGRYYDFVSGGANMAILNDPGFTYVFPPSGNATFSPSTATTVPFVASWHCDYDASRLCMAQNGSTAVADQREYHGFVPPNDGATAQLNIGRTSVSEAHVREVIILAGHHDQEVIRTLAALRQARL